MLHILHDVQKAIPVRASFHLTALDFMERWRLKLEQRINADLISFDYIY